MAPVLSKTPETLVTRGWSDYALLDSGDGKKLERYGRYTVVRPEPQCFWSPRDPTAFEAATAYGVLGMRERARHFGGRIDIASAVGQGSTFVLHLPLPVRTA